MLNQEYVKADFPGYINEIIEVSIVKHFRNIL